MNVASVGTFDQDATCAGRSISGTTRIPRLCAYLQQNARNFGSVHGRSVKGCLPNEIINC